MPTRPRRIRDELLDHGWWLVPLLLLFWFRQLELPGPEPVPAPGESAHAVKGWELLTIVRLGIDSVSSLGRLGWFHDQPELAQLFWWKYWACEIGLKLALCGVCGLALLRTPGKFARAGFALALLAMPAGLDALACVALLAIFRQQLAGGGLGWLVVAALLAQVQFSYFLLWGAGLALVSVALWADGSWRLAGSFLVRGLGAFLFLWLALGQSAAHFPLWLRTSWWIADANDAAQARQLWLSLGMLAALGLLLLLESGRGARPRALQALVLAAALIAWRGDESLFFALAPAAAWFALRAERRLAADLLRVGILAAGVCGLGPPAPLSLQTLRDLADPVGLRTRTSVRGAELAEQWDLPRVRERAALETLDVFQDSQAVVFLNGLNFHPRPVFQSRWAATPRLLELNRAFYAGERAPQFALYRVEPCDGELAPAVDAKALDELLLRYRPCFEERGWLLLQRESEPVRAQASTPLETRSHAFGEWLEFADVRGEALELRMDPRPSARGRLQTLLLGRPRLECEIERADGSRTRAGLVPGAARAGFLVRPFVETQAGLAQVFVGRPQAGLARLRLLAAPGEEPLWNPRFVATLVRRDGLLPPLREELALAFDFADFVPPPLQRIGGEGLRVEEQDGHPVHVLPAPSSLRWQLQPGRYRMSGSYGMLDAAWQVPEPSDGALVSVVLWEGREQRLLLRRLLDPARSQPDRGSQPLLLEFELLEPAQLFVRARVGLHEDARRDWVFWDSLKIERR